MVTVITDSVIRMVIRDTVIVIRDTVIENSICKKGHSNEDGNYNKEHSDGEW